MSGYGPPGQGPPPYGAPPPPPPGPGPKPWLAIGVAVIGSCVLTAGLALAAGVTLGMLFWQLLANVVMVVFVQELRWYGPGVFDAGEDVWLWVLWLSAIGGALVAVAATMLSRTGTAFPRPRRGGRAGP